MLICNHKLAKISYELDKMIKYGFIEQIFIPNSLPLSILSTPESSKKRVELLLESSDIILKNAKTHQNKTEEPLEKRNETIKIAEITRKLDELGVDKKIDTN